MPFTALTAPIAGPDAGGIDLAFLSEFDDIQEARRADDPSLEQGEWTRDLKTADWPRVARLCHASLRDRSKDLRVAGWYLEALTQIKGLPGLAEGLGLVAELCERMWPDLHPRSEDDEERLGCLRWMVGQAPRWIRAAPVTPDVAHEGYAAVQTALSALDRLEAALDAQVPGDGPSLSGLREVLRAVLATAEPPSETGAVDKSAHERTFKAKTAEQDEPSPMRADALSSRSESCPLPFSHRDDALDSLRKVARFFRETEPHSPVAYLADRAARWGDMPLHEWLEQVLGEGDALGRMRDVLDIRRGPGTP